MDEKLDEILTKHFAGQCLPDEERYVTSWKKENAKAYEVLKQVWLNGEFSVSKQYDTTKAWISVEKETIGSTKVIPLTRNNRIVWAAAASLLIIVTLLVLFFLKRQEALPALVFENTGQNILPIALPDSSHAWLNTGAKLTFHPNMANERKIELKGEAFFEVTRNPLKPCVIASKHGSVIVLGTSFNVKVRDDACVVSVKSGTVKLQSGTNSRLLTRGQEATANASGMVSIPAAYSANFVSWKTGEFTFNDVLLCDLIEELNTFYNNKFECNTLEPNSCKLTVRFKNNTPQEVEEIIKQICNIKAEHKGDKVIFSKP